MSLFDADAYGGYIANDEFIKSFDFVASFGATVTVDIYKGSNGKLFSKYNCQSGMVHELFKSHEWLIQATESDIENYIEEYGEAKQRWLYYQEWLDKPKRMEQWVENIRANFSTNLHEKIEIIISFLYGNIEMRLYENVYNHQIWFKTYDELEKAQEDFDLLMKGLVPSTSKSRCYRKLANGKEFPRIAQFEKKLSIKELADRL